MFSHLHRRAAAVTAAVAVAATLLGGCGGSPEPKKEPAQRADRNEPKPPASADQKRMVQAIETMVDGIEGADDCDGGRVEGSTLRFGDAEDDRWRPTPTQWLGPDQDPKADGTRPEFVGRVFFCGGKGKDSGTRYLLYLHGFESEQTAQRWFDELKAAADDGLELDRTGDDNPHYVSSGGLPPPMEADCEPVGTQQSAEFGAGVGAELDGAIDVVLEYPCASGDPGPFDWDPTTLATVASGPWVASLEVSRSSGSIPWEDPDEEGQAYTSAKTIKVQRPEQAEALSTLVEALNEPGTE